MLISQTIVVDQQIDDVWQFFYDIPQVAACIPGADLTDKMAEDHYSGDVIISAGPVKLEFSGQAKVETRDNAKKIITINASGSDKKGRGEAQAVLVAALNPVAGGTSVKISLDLIVSGAAAQFGRGLIADVTAVLVNQTAGSMQARMKAISMGIDPNTVGGPKAASGLAIAMTVVRKAAARIFARFFLPYQPAPRR
jgi:carbon monoxide dehydrogenase subunit G